MEFYKLFQQQNGDDRGNSKIWKFNTVKIVQSKQQRENRVNKTKNQNQGANYKTQGPMGV